MVSLQRNMPIRGRQLSAWFEISKRRRIRAGLCGPWHLLPYSESRKATASPSTRSVGRWAI